jgi:hypothetical protein
VHARLPLRRLPARLLLDSKANCDETGTAPPVSPNGHLAYPAVMPGAPYYAEAFSPLPGRCFRMVTRQGGGAGPTHCPQPVVWRGSWRAPNGRRYRIEACEGHRPAPDAGSGPTA